MLPTNELFFFITPFTPAYDEPPPPTAEEEEKGREEEKDKGKVKVKLTPEQQAFVNSLVAEERRKAQQKTEALITQLETEKNRSGTTAAEKAQLEERIETLKNEFATKDELKSRDTAKKLAALEAKAKELETESVTWKTRYERDFKKADLQKAAAQEKAYNPDQVVTLLFDNSRRVEILDEEGKPTGEFETKVKIQSKDKAGKPVVLDLSPVEAIRQLKEQPEYFNLFVSNVAGGLGGNNLGRGNGGGKKPHEMSTEEYIAERNKSRRGGN